MVDEPRTEVFKRRILFCKFQAKPRSVCYRGQMARRDSSAKPQARDPVTLGIFARRLGESMTARRLSALQVAEGAGVDERTVALWLAAEVEPQLFRADQAAQLLGTSLDALLGAPPYPAPPRPTSDIASLFGRRLEAQILRSGRETTEVAEKAQVARNSLNRWKAGTAEPRLLAAWRVARELGVGLDVLLGYQPLPPISGRAAAMLMLGEE